MVNSAERKESIINSESCAMQNKPYNLSKSDTENGSSKPEKAHGGKTPATKCVTHSSVYFAKVNKCNKKEGNFVVSKFCKGKY